ncbi:hypothetical protein [Sphingomonas sp. ERG5]|uniref:hypothetical protein n=1 Tax=Sphingomonas sp. ERG5 TaxID=1381597 RepID=UPI001269E5DA|nr:hypothetical protein [Sphingomonas sp. ERG5]
MTNTLHASSSNRRNACAFEEQGVCLLEPGRITGKVRPFRLLPVSHHDRYIGDLSIMDKPNFDR